MLGNEELLRADDVLSLSDVTYRQLDYWARSGVVPPYHGARGSGTQRRWALEQVRVVRLVAALSRLGAEGARLRRAAREATALTEEDWTGLAVIDADGRLSVTGDVPYGTEG